MDLNDDITEERILLSIENTTALKEIILGAMKSVIPCVEVTDPSMSKLIDDQQKNIMKMFIRSVETLINLSKKRDMTLETTGAFRKLLDDLILETASHMHAFDFILDRLDELIVTEPVQRWPTALTGRYVPLDVNTDLGSAIIDLSNNVNSCWYRGDNSQSAVLAGIWIFSFIEDALRKNLFTGQQWILDLDNETKTYMRLEDSKSQKNFMNWGLPLFKSNEMTERKSFVLAVTQLVPMMTLLETIRYKILHVMTEDTKAIRKIRFIKNEVISVHVKSPKWLKACISVCTSLCFWLINECLSILSRTETHEIECSKKHGYVQTLIKQSKGLIKLIDGSDEHSIFETLNTTTSLWKDKSMALMKRIVNYMMIDKSGTNSFVPSQFASNAIMNIMTGILGTSNEESIPLTISINLSIYRFLQLMPSTTVDAMDLLLSISEENQLTVTFSHFPQEILKKASELRDVTLSYYFIIGVVKIWQTMKTCIDFGHTRDDLSSLLNDEKIYEIFPKLLEAPKLIWLSIVLLVNHIPDAPYGVVKKNLLNKLDHLAPSVFKEGQPLRLFLLSQETGYVGNPFEWSSERYEHTFLNTTGFLDVIRYCDLIHYISTIFKILGSASYNIDKVISKDMIYLIRYVLMPVFLGCIDMALCELNASKDPKPIVLSVLSMIHSVVVSSATRNRGMGRDSFQFVSKTDAQLVCDNEIMRSWNDAMRDENKHFADDIRRLIQTAQNLFLWDECNIMVHLNYVPGIDPNFPLFDKPDQLSQSLAYWQIYWKTTVNINTVVLFDTISPWYDKNVIEDRTSHLSSYMASIEDNKDMFNDQRTRCYRVMRAARKTIESSCKTWHDVVTSNPHIDLYHKYKENAFFNGSRSAELCPLLHISSSMTYLVDNKKSTPYYDLSLEVITGSRHPFTTLEEAEKTMSMMIAQRVMNDIGIEAKRKQHDLLFFGVAMETFRLWTSSCDTASGGQLERIEVNWINTESLVRMARFVGMNLDSSQRISKRHLSSARTVAFRDAKKRCEYHSFFSRESDRHPKDNFWNWISLFEEKMINNQSQRCLEKPKPRFVSAIYSFLASVSHEFLIVYERKDSNTMKRFFGKIMPLNFKDPLTFYEGVLVPFKDVIYYEDICSNSYNLWTLITLWEMLEEIVLESMKLQQVYVPESPWFSSGCYHHPTVDIARSVTVLSPNLEEPTKISANHVCKPLCSLAAVILQALVSKKLAPSHKLLVFVDIARGVESTGKETVLKGQIQAFIPENCLVKNVCPFCLDDIETGQMIYVSNCIHALHVKCACCLADNFHKKRKECVEMILRNDNLQQVVEWQEGELNVHWEVQNLMESTINTNSCPICRTHNVFYDCGRNVISDTHTPRDFYMDMNRIYVAKIVDATDSGSTRTIDSTRSNKRIKINRI